MYWHEGEVNDRFNELERDNVKHGPSDGRVTEQHELQTHLGNPDWVKGYQDQPHQPGPLPQEGAPTGYETTHPNGFVQHRYPDLMEKLLTTGDPRGKQQFHRDEQGVVHAYDQDGNHQEWRPKFASGLGMPSDGTMSGAPVTQSADETNAPEPQQQPLAVTPNGQVLPTIDPNQMTTKPRQMPGGSGGGAGGFDPKMNGSEGGPGSPLSPDPSDGGGDDDSAPSTAAPKESRRRRHAVAMKVTALTSQVRQDRPDLTFLQARQVARKIVAAYPMIVAEGFYDNPLAYGTSRDIADGPLTNYLKNGPDKKKKPEDDEEEKPAEAPVESHPGAAQHVPPSAAPGRHRAPREPWSGSGLANAFERVKRTAPVAEEAAEVAVLAKTLPLLAL